MTIEITEKDAIKRLRNGLLEAADLVVQLDKPDVYPSSSRLFMKAMKEASGSANILGFYQDRPDFFRLRDMLEMMAAQVAELATARYFNTSQIKLNGSNPFQIIKIQLENAAVAAKKIGESKSQSKTDLEQTLVAREHFVAINKEKLN